MKRRNKLFTKVAVVVAFSCVALLPLTASAANKFIVMDATGTIPKFVVTDTGYIGVGITAPDAPITLKSSGLFPSNVIKIIGDETTKGAGLIGYSNRTDGITLS